MASLVLCVGVPHMRGEFGAKHGAAGGEVQTGPCTAPGAAFLTGVCAAGLGATRTWREMTCVSLSTVLGNSALRHPGCCFSAVAGGHERGVGRA